MVIKPHRLRIISSSWLLLRPPTKIKGCWWPRSTFQNFWSHSKMHRIVRPKTQRPRCWLLDLKKMRLSIKSLVSKRSLSINLSIRPQLMLCKEDCKMINFLPSKIVSSLWLRALLRGVFLMRLFQSLESASYVRKVFKIISSTWAQWSTRNGKTPIFQNRAKRFLCR